MGLPPLSFVGISEFSESFQTLLERSFTVANLPIQGLQTEQTLLLTRQTELATLEADLQSLQSVFSTLGILGAQGAVTASSSNTLAATVLVTGTPTPGSFELDVTSAASVAQETSLAGVSALTDLLSADGIFALTLGATTTNIDLLTIGSGRTAGTTGSSTPDPKVSVQVDFTNGLTGSITAELESFFVASAGVSGAASGDSVSVSFTSTDGLISETIDTGALTGGEDAAALAIALNTAIAGNSNLTGKVSFQDEGGFLKLVVADTAGTGFDFTSTSTGTVVSGLEAGGTAGGHSAEEIAAALNTQVALDTALTAAGVSFVAENGEVRVKGNQAFDVTTTDSAQGTGFVSGLASAQSVLGYDNSLQGLTDYVNANSSTLGVKATIINTSSDPLNPDYHLTLTANDTGATTLTLEDSGSTDLLGSSNQGTDAVFTVNGLLVTNSGNNIVDFAPGISLTIVGAGQTTVAALDDRTGIKNALNSFVVEHNATVARIGSHIGDGAGILSGDILIRESQSALRDIRGFAGTGTIKSMVELGLELDEKGQLSFDSVVFDTLANADFDAIRTFLGDTTSGFAGNAFSRVKDLSDPVVGQIQTAIGFIEESDARLTLQIQSEQERVDLLIANLEQQFAAADVLLSQLESQQTLLTELFKDRSNNFL